MSESPSSDDDLTGEPHGRPPGEHDSELPDGADGPDDAPETQEENAETSMDQPSQ